MANITYAHTTAGLGLTTLRASVYAKDGTRRENPDLTGTEKTAANGEYLFASANIVAGDDVRIYDTGAPTITLGSGEYKPEATVDFTTVLAGQATIESDIAAAQAAQSRVLNTFAPPKGYRE